DELDKMPRENHRIPLDEFIKCAGTKSDIRRRRFIKFIGELIRHEKLCAAQGSGEIIPETSGKEVEKRMQTLRGGISLYESDGTPANQKVDELWHRWRAWLGELSSYPVECDPRTVDIFRLAR
ncbi:MAG: hypothetical protein AAF514_20810, partial [Verrucomicrobiota bacterium]